MTWRAASLVYEGLANLRANAFRSLLLVGISAATFGGLALLELRQGLELVRFARDYRDGGAFVVIASASGGGVSGARCDSLNNEPGVVAAGAWRSTGQSTFAGAPGVLFQAADVTSGLFRIWDTRQSLGVGPGVVAGPAAASEVGLRPGLIATFVAEEAVRVSGIVNSARRVPQIARWVLSPVPPERNFDECWVEFEPGAYEGGPAALGARLAEGSLEPTVRPLRRSDEFTRDPAAEWASRPQKLGWLGVSILLFGFALVGAWFRRSEAGLYLAMGTRRAQLAVMAAAESWPAVIAGWSLGFTCAVGAARLGTGAPTVDWALRSAVTSGSAALIAVALVPWAPPLVARGSIASLLKDR